MQAVSFRCTYQVARMEHHWSILSGLRERKRMLDDEETLAISAKAQSCSFFFFSQPAPYTCYILALTMQIWLVKGGGVSS